MNTLLLSQNRGCIIKGEEVESGCQHMTRLLNIIENNEMSCAQSGNLETQRKRE